MKSASSPPSRATKIWLYLSLSIPQILVIAVHLLTVKYAGFAKSGEIAFWAAISSVLAVVLGMRGDVKIMTDDLSRLHKNTFSGIFVVLFLVGLALIVFMIIPDQRIALDLRDIVLTAGGVALLELFSAIMIRCGFIARHVIIRCAPYLVMTYLILVDGSLGGKELWLNSVVLGLVFAVILSSTTLYAAFAKLEKGFLQLHYYLRAAFYPTLSTMLRIGSLNLLVIIVGFDYSAIDSGLWTNLYRVISAPIFFIFSITQTLILIGIGSIDCPHEKLKISRRRWFTFCLGFVFYVPIVLILSAFFVYLNPDKTVPMIMVASALGMSLYRIFSQHVENTLQAIGLSQISVIICVIELIIIMVNRKLFCCDIYSFLMVTSSCFMVLFTVLMASERHVSKLMVKNVL